MAMTLRLTPDQETKLAKLATIRNVSKQQMVSLAVEEAYERSVYNERLDVAIDSVLDEYADALERLGK